MGFIWEHFPRYRIIVEFEFRVRDGDHLALRCTSKVGVVFFVSPTLTREEQTVVAMSVLENKLWSRKPRPSRARSEGVACVTVSEVKR